MQETTSPLGYWVLTEEIDKVVTNKMMQWSEDRQCWDWEEERDEVRVELCKQMIIES